LDTTVKSLKPLVTEYSRRCRAAGKGQPRERQRQKNVESFCVAQIHVTFAARAPQSHCRGYRASDSQLQACKKSCSKPTSCTQRYCISWETMRTQTKERGLRKEIQKTLPEGLLLGVELAEVPDVLLMLSAVAAAVTLLGAVGTAAAVSGGVTAAAAGTAVAFAAATAGLAGTGVRSWRRMPAVLLGTTVAFAAGAG
jgi:hypothetical protein